MDAIRKQLKVLQSCPQNVRNICILAHVDHGKTTLSDSLLAANGIISSKLAGKVRYLDSREDEIERGITMKASGVSLLVNIRDCASSTATSISTSTNEFLVNLIDSPGHVDFASEVSTASRLCDGCLVLVDAVEGVCTQTHTVLRQALSENIKPILVINKIDRLIQQLKMSPHEAYSHMSMILQEVNAIVGTFHMENLIADDAKAYEEAVKKQQAAVFEQTGSQDVSRAVDEWILEDRDDEHLYFSPEKGNVVFASAIDGWAFRIDHFAALYTSKLGVKESSLKKVLWGDFYLDPKTKRAIGPKGLKGRLLKPFFVQFILDNLWAVYDAVENDREKLEKIVKVLNLKIPPRDLKSKDPKPVLQTVMNHWLPLASTILKATVEIIPSPVEASKIRIPLLLKTLAPLSPLSGGSNQFSEEESAMIACDASSQHTIAYVSKMFAVPADVIESSLKTAVGGVVGSTSDRVQLSSEDVREQRRLAVVAERAARKKAVLENGGALGVEAGEAQVVKERESDDIKPMDIGAVAAAAVAAQAAIVEARVEEKDKLVSETLIGFARCYSGTVKIGQKLHVLGPKYHPSKPQLFRTEFTVAKLYMMMGRELQELDEVPAGNVFGIGGLEGHVLKSGTLSSSTHVRSFGSVNGDAPILRVALEPSNPVVTGNMNKLVEGLRLLNQADPCVEVVLQETGEHVIITAGALHLESLKIETLNNDLRERFAKIDIQVSEPIVPFRETISTTPALQNLQKIDSEHAEDDTLPTGTIISSIAGNLASIRIRAVPLPKCVLSFLESNARRLKSLSEVDQIGAEQLKARESFIVDLEGILLGAKKESDIVDKHIWDKLGKRILSFGPKEIGPNILFGIRGSDASLWIKNISSGKIRQKKDTDSDLLPISQEKTEIVEDAADDTENVKSATSRFQTAKDYEGSVVVGFQLAMQAGPLCNEPLMGVAIFIEDFQVNLQDADNRQIGLLPGQIMAMTRDACRQAFLKWSPRLALAMYSCDLQAPSEVLGKVYAVLNKRHGRILSEEIKDGTPFFQIKSLLPVIESFGFSDDIRKRTAGTASPQLIFSGFEVLDIDPFWVPTTQEELEDLGEKADRENVAKRYMEGTIFWKMKADSAVGIGDVTSITNNNFVVLGRNSQHISFAETRSQMNKAGITAEIWPRLVPINFFLPLTQTIAHVASSLIMAVLVLISFVQDISTLIERYFPAFYYLFPQPPERKLPSPTTGITDEQNRILAHSHVRKFHRELVNPRVIMRRNSLQHLKQETPIIPQEEFHNDVEVVDDNVTALKSVRGAPPSFLKRIASIVAVPSSHVSAIINGKTKIKNKADNRIPKMNTRAYIEAAGYKCQTYSVTTNDGFVLQLDRILPGSKTPAELVPQSLKPPVILMHGLFQSGGVWVTSGQKSFAFYLVENNYDVWVANNRVCCFEAPTQHISLSASDPEFWNWSLDELAQYDIPAIIEGVRRFTGWSKVGYVGHSQGNAQMFLALSLNPLLNEKLSVFIALAPAVYIGPLLDAFPLDLLINLDEWWFRAIFGVNQFLPAMSDTNWDINNKIHYFQFTPRPQSSKAMQHWCQMGKYKVVQQFHSQKFIRTEPKTEFDVSCLKCPIALYYGTKDAIVDARKLHWQCWEGSIEKNGNSGNGGVVDLVAVEEVEGYEHMDCLWGVNAEEKVWRRVLRVFEGVDWH
ncbi:Cytoplasmic GTPase/eEF2-like protein (ribosomal biogenesis) [Physocladia obscura]|uniref:Elongation factor 2 n=1 Tax=Physocladia obscura TaxID=109957 RepID=A0AAD5XC60_9FUNG|nr:Cytoplasmic GTPase/eEF2-like protein (ribosomal biogenesis) [Physocladia obscura]